MHLGMLAGTGLCSYLTAAGLSHPLEVSNARATGPRVALTCWLPLAVCVLVAMAMGHATLAVTLIYTTSLAAVTGVLGSALLTGHDVPSQPASSAGGVIITLALPMVAMTWLIGFSGNITPVYALALLIGSLVTLYAWAGREPGGVPDPAPTVMPVSHVIRLVEAAIALVPAVAGAWAAIRFANTASAPLARVSPELIAVLPLSPVLLVPLFLRTATLVRNYEAPEAIALGSGIVVMNLGVLLPLAALAHLVAGWLPAATAHPATTSAPTTSISTDLFPQMSLLGVPLILWRLDNVFLLVAILIFVGIRLGFYRPGHRMGIALMLLYFGYFVLSVLLRLS